MRYVLAVTKEGSAVAAARALKVNHSTVVRRVCSFEDRLEVRLFDHLATGYRLTPSGNSTPTSRCAALGCPATDEG